MKNNWFVYIKIDTNNRKVKSSGIKFNESIKGIKDKPKNILILSGDSIYSELNTDLNLEYINGKGLIEFYTEDVYSFGDFHWVDFEEEENLNNIDKLDLAKILYLNHKGIPFDTFIFKSLKVEKSIYQTYQMTY